jgi:phosphate transport system substrate-binding protein
MAIACGCVPLPTLAQSIRVGGTGGALELLAQLGSDFTANAGPLVEVAPSLGTSGGLRALSDGVLDLAVAGRPLNAAERVAGLHAVVSLTTLYVLATSLRDPPSITLADVPRLFADPQAAWPNGTAVRPILRPTQESDYLVLYRLFPGTEAAVAALRRRDDVPIAATDQDNQVMAAQLPGSLIGTTLSQMLTEHRDLRMVPINGVVPGVATLLDGSYHFCKDLVFVVGPHPTAAVERFLDFIRSDQERDRLSRDGTLLDGG